MTSQSSVAALNSLGQSPWYDNLTRALATGGLQALLDHDGIRGVTSNPTIFEKAMGSGNDYDAQLAMLRNESTESAYWTMVVDDIRGACDILMPVYVSTSGVDGYVSVEVSPEFARATDETVHQAKELWARIDRPNVMIKIPATVEGLPAITAVLAAGINVNVTLIFSLERHQAVLDAHSLGLEQRAATGADISTVHSVASFFISRVDTETDHRLPEGHALRGKAAVANAKLAYELFCNHIASPRWSALASQHAPVQRPLWASTSTKNPAYSPTLYVDELIGPNTVNTLAQASVDALQVHDGLRANSVSDDIAGARATMAALATAGVDFDDVALTLELEGVESFAASFRNVLATLESKRATL